MSGGGSMFGEAFNLFSCGMQFQEFRNKLRNVGANFYSVSPKPEESADVFHERYTNWESHKTSEPPIPSYYKKVNNDIIEVCSNNVTTNWSNNFRQLNIDMIIQDGTDKDNLSAMSLLGNMNQSEKIPVHFVGARMYKSSSRPFGTPKEAGGPTFNPDSFKRFRVNPNTQECEKPMDTRNFNKDKKQHVYGNIEFLKDITVSFYKHQMNGFKECLDDVMPNKSIDGIFEFIEGGIVDGTETKSLSLRAPFNMSLFFFAPNTYMSSFNPWPKLLKAQQQPFWGSSKREKRTRKGGKLKKKNNNKTIKFKKKT